MFSILGVMPTADKTISHSITSIPFFVFKATLQPLLLVSTSVTSVLVREEGGG